jgi:hypothetical protein
MRIGNQVSKANWQLDSKSTGIPNRSKTLKNSLETLAPYRRGFQIY